MIRLYEFIFLFPVYLCLYEFIFRAWPIRLARNPWGLSFFCSLSFSSFMFTNKWTSSGVRPDILVSLSSYSVDRKHQLPWYQMLLKPCYGCRINLVAATCGKHLNWHPCQLRVAIFTILSLLKSVVLYDASMAPKWANCTAFWHAQCTLDEI